MEGGVVGGLRVVGGWGRGEHLGLANTSHVHRRVVTHNSQYYRRVKNPNQQTLSHQRLLQPTKTWTQTIPKLNRKDILPHSLLRQQIKSIIIMKGHLLSSHNQSQNPQEIGSIHTKPSQISDPSFDVTDYYTNYTLHQNLFTKRELENQDNFTIVKGKNYVYFGGLKDGVREGWGVLIVGDVLYEGRFHNNHKAGVGYQKQKKGTVFNGEFKESLFEGSGVMTYQDGSHYTGCFRRGVMEGEGMWVNQAGDKYIGQWAGGKANGRGILISSKNDRYQGDFKEFVKDGAGIETFANGDVFEGYYEGNTPMGYGQYFWRDGSVYKGMFMNGLKHGRGIWRSPNGDSYEGYYQNDKKSGSGEMKWENGNVYIGEFFNDLRHGEGEMKWVNGTEFHGTWQKGVPDGPGVLSSPEKRKKCGIFKENQLLKEMKEEKNWKGPEGLKKPSRNKTFDNQGRYYQKLKPILEKVKRPAKKVNPRITQRVNPSLDERSRQKMRWKQNKQVSTPFYLPLPPQKYKLIPPGYRNSSLSVGTRGFPIVIKPNLSLNSSPLNIRIRVEKTKRGMEIRAQQLRR